MPPVRASQKSNDVGLERVKLKSCGKPRPTTYVIIFSCMCVYDEITRISRGSSFTAIVR